MENEKKYTEKDLIEFGNHLLSKKRNEKIYGDKSVVYDSDLENWKNSKPFEFDPFCLPAWAKWIAMDEDGDWFLYVKKPFLDKELGGFNYDRVLDNGNIEIATGLIPLKYAPKNFKGSWKDSLMKVKDLKEKALRDESTKNYFAD